MTIRNSYPLPLISDLLDRVKGAKVFTKLDLKSTYNLVRIKEGLCYFQVLEKLLENNLYVKLEKCEFDKSETTFLGYVISKNGLKMDKEKVKAILDWPAPTNVKEVQSFIGLCNYYRLFIKDFAKIANPIYKLTRKNFQFDWGKEQQKAFDTLKHLFTSAPFLKHLDSNKPFIVETDASDFAVGAILSQEFDGKIHPVAFLSKSLTKYQRNYQIYANATINIKF